MAKPLIIVIIAVIVLAGIVYVLSGPGKGPYAPVPTPPSTPSVAGQGRVVFAVTDVADASLQGATAVVITVDKLEAHSAAQGWVTVSSAVKQYDLLELKESGSSELLADAKLAAGTYEQILLNISRVDVTAAGKVQEAKLPSHTLKIVGNLVVDADQTSSMTLDFMVDKSLHLTGSGKYILAPVVKIESKSEADVEIGLAGKVVVKGGKVEIEETVGMDEKGETKVDFELKGNLNIDVNGLIHVEGKAEAKAGVNVALKAENNSGISGSATFQEEGGKVRVKLELTGSILGLILPAEPAHIHAGACPNVGAVVYPLQSVVNGKSETVLNVSWDSLKAQLPLAINVHKSSAEAGTYVACGDITL